VKAGKITKYRLWSKKNNLKNCCCNFFVYFLFFWLKCVISLCFQKKAKIFPKNEKILEVTIFKNQYFLNNKNRPPSVLREEASDSLLPAYQVLNFLKICYSVISFSVTTPSCCCGFLFGFCNNFYYNTFATSSTTWFYRKNWLSCDRKCKSKYEETRKVCAAILEKRAMQIFFCFLCMQTCKKN
jgi:hypothetical protein